MIDLLRAVFLLTRGSYKWLRAVPRRVRDVRQIIPFAWRNDPILINFRFHDAPLYFGIKDRGLVKHCEFTSVDRSCVYFVPENEKPLPPTVVPADHVPEPGVGSASEGHDPLV